MRKLLLMFLFSGSLLAKAGELTGIKWTSYPGCRQTGHCLEYALALQLDLQSRGIESYYKEYEWKSFTGHGAHALVIIHADNKWFISDNESPFPRWIDGKTGSEGLDFPKMIKQKYGHVTKVR